MYERKQETTKRGLKLNSFSIYTMAAASVLVVGMLTVTFFMSYNHREINDSANDYIELSKQAEVVEDASDYLTEQVRLFVVTGELQYAEEYFKEANVTRRRENALTVLQGHHLANEWSGHMEKAVATSNALMEREIYAMKLVAVANDYAAEQLPEKVQAAILEEADGGLSSENMVDKAMNMVFDAEYQHTKAVIYEHLSYFTEGILLATEKDMAVGLNRLSGVIFVECVLLLAIAGIVILTFVVIRRYLVKPLHAQLKAVEERSAVKEVGVYELQCLVEAYQEKLFLNVGAGAESDR